MSYYKERMKCLQRTKCQLSSGDAIFIAQDNAIYITQSTPFAQRGGREKISASAQTERIEMVEMSKKNIVEMFTQTEEEDTPTKCMSTRSEDRQENNGMTGPIQESA